MSFQTTGTPSPDRTLFDHFLNTLAGCAITVVSFSFLLWLRF